MQIWPVTRNNHELECSWREAELVDSILYRTGINKLMMYVQESRLYEEISVKVNSAWLHWAFM